MVYKQAKPEFKLLKLITLLFASQSDQIRSASRAAKELNVFSAVGVRLIDVSGDSSRNGDQSARGRLHPHVGIPRSDWLAPSNVDCGWVKPHVEISFNH